MGKTSMKKSNSRKPASTRRDFLTTSRCRDVCEVQSPPAWEMSLTCTQLEATHDQEVGLIGCGARGSGAADQVGQSRTQCQTGCDGDAFKEHLMKAEKGSSNNTATRLTFLPIGALSWFDACQKVLSSDVNYVILATPPGFRPSHLKAAVAAGKHLHREAGGCGRSGHPHLPCRL
jgi:hypothetical protein